MTETTKTKRGPKSATEKLTEARDQQERLIERLQGRVEKAKDLYLGLKDQLGNAYGELARYETALRADEPKASRALPADDPRFRAHTPDPS